MALANLLALDSADDAYFEDLLRILESEPNFGARLLIAANSAESAPAAPVTTLPRAVARIGSRGAADLVLAMSVTRVFVPRDPWEKSLWRHGVQVAHAARELARHAPGLDPDEVYAAALLHDIGRFILFQEGPEQLRAIDEGDWDSPESLVEQEVLICGLSHAELGAMACRKWRLPDVVIQVVSRHHDPLPAQLTDPIDKIVAVVRLADLAMFPSAMTGGVSIVAQCNDTELVAYLEPRMPAFLSLGGPQFRTIMLRAEVESERACHALGIG